MSVWGQNGTKGYFSHKWAISLVQMSMEHETAFVVHVFSLLSFHKKEFTFSETLPHIFF